MDAEISDNTDGSEDARLHLYILVSGVLQRLFSTGAVLACFAASSRTIDRPRATASGVARQPRKEPMADKLWQHRKVCWLWFCTRCCQHRVDLTPVVGLVVEELNSTESFWLLDSR
jgi:hypothetical protein